MALNCEDYLGQDDPSPVLESRPLQLSWIPDSMNYLLLGCKRMCEYSTANLHDDYFDKLCCRAFCLMPHLFYQEQTNFLVNVRDRLGCYAA